MSARKRRPMMKRLEIERVGSVVRFIVHCGSEYDAMLLYDSANREALIGGFDLEIATRKVRFGKDADDPAA